MYKFMHKFVPREGRGVGGVGGERGRGRKRERREERERERERESSCIYTETERETGILRDRRTDMEREFYCQV